jgi:hypothetical protein
VHLADCFKNENDAIKKYRCKMKLWNVEVPNAPYSNRYNCERKHQSLDYQTPEKLFKKIV